ncbi:hypothetical protein HK102_013905 [Quaeritorhiza haematococci]|nr:hypothetical protein HK102_013905 [Quaeritorhiza haematococci]
MAAVSAFRMRGGNILQRSVTGALPRPSACCLRDQLRWNSTASATQSSPSSSPLSKGNESSLTAKPRESIQPSTWTKETRDALNLLRQQQQYYAILEIKGRPYYVTPNDVVITMRMKDLALGDVLVLDRIREIGSADYILKGNPYVHPSFFTLKAVVIEHPVSAEIVVEKKKRRGSNKVVTNQNHHTALRIVSIEINK